MSEENIAVFGPRLRIYLAGKINRNPWREQILRLWRHTSVWNHRNLDVNERWPILRNAILGYHDYVGPFVNVAYDDFTENDCHGLESFFGKDEGNDHPALDASGIMIPTLCFNALSRANFVFAWLDAPNAYGTFCELGYAYAKDKPVYLASTPDFRYRQDLWFVEGNARNWIVGNSALECLENALREHSINRRSTGPVFHYNPDPKFVEDAVARKWSYFPARISAPAWAREPATKKQIDYLLKLAEEEPEIARDMLHIVRLEFGENATFQQCNKGVAGFVIGALLRNILPIQPYNGPTNEDQLSFG